ncbi:MAG: hypothetical protein SWC96_14370 [Thermodesulfobacteriota bacterium]|nr:hypothetical protein [Thermodesulfobacteriota bacterium]
MTDTVITDIQALLGKRGIPVSGVAAALGAVGHPLAGGKKPAADRADGPVCLKLF